MTENAVKQRHFTSRELITYFLLLNVSFGALHFAAGLDESWPTPVLFLSSILALIALCLLGGLLGSGICVLIAGRQFGRTGALLGAVLLPLLLFIGFGIMVYRAVDRPTSPHQLRKKPRQSVSGVNAQPRLVDSAQPHSEAQRVDRARSSPPAGRGGAAGAAKVASGADPISPSSRLYSCLG